MEKHIKPTKEELEANTQKALEEAEALKNKQTPVPAPSSDEPPAQPSPNKPIPSPEVPPEKPEKPIEPDYKKRYVESTKEAQILFNKNKKLTEAFDKATETPEPTEEELKAEYRDWDVMSDFERKMAKDVMISNRRFKAIEDVSKDFKDLDNWQNKVNAFVEDPKTLVDYPGLEGRQDEFRLFSINPTRRGLDFPDLISAFLYTLDTGKPAKKKGQMFETGSGGPNERVKPKSGKISLDEARQLRKTDYNKWTEYVKAGKIDTEEI